MAQAEVRLQSGHDGSEASVVQLAVREERDRLEAPLVRLAVPKVNKLKRIFQIEREARLLLLAVLFVAGACLALLFFLS